MEERLQKILARCAGVSRRKAEELIADGRVRVNGNTARLGEQADGEEDVIELDGVRVRTRQEPEKIYRMLCKPRGFVTTMNDELGRRCVAELVEDVHLIKLASGSDSLLIDFLVERNVRGLVLEAFGRGNVPPAALPGIRRAVEKGIPVVITTRTIAGRVLDVYGYEGGAKTVLEAGGILGGETSGPKARLKLMLALGVASGRDELAVFFDTP